jgi:hypothetical protein
LENPKENPPNVDSLAAETNQGVDDAAALPSRLDRYSRAHHRALEMAHYATEKGEVKLATRMENCGSLLLFRDYYTVGKVRLHAARFCKKHLLCPLCAIRRGAKMVKSYMDRLAVLKAANPALKAYLVTLTVKDGEDLGERFDHLQSSIQKLHKTRTGSRQYSEACKAEGAVWSYEFKRGKKSGLWHPHVHAVWLCNEAPDARALSQQWHGITGDSFIVDVTPFHDQNDVLTGFLEVFKYAVKFSDLPLQDNWHGFETLAGKRLIASFGSFRGVEVPEELTDEQLDYLPFFEHLYRFVRNVGYSRVPEEEKLGWKHHGKPKNPAKLPPRPEVVKDPKTAEILRRNAEHCAELIESGSNRYEARVTRRLIFEALALPDK